MSVERVEGGVRGVFLTLDEAAEAVNALEREGFAPQEITVFSPIPTPHLEALIDRPTSPVRMMTLIGGILGCITGFTLTYWTFFAWPSRITISSWAAALAWVPVASTPYFFAKASACSTISPVLE